MMGDQPKRSRTPCPCATLTAKRARSRSRSPSRRDGSRRRDDEIAAATEATLLRTAAAADAALKRGDRAAEGTREKIHEQQERFKAGVVADGLSLDEPVEVLVRQQKVADAGGVNVTGNKYAHLMHTRKLQQEVERQ